MSLVPDTQGEYPQYNAFSPSSVCTPPLHFAPVSIISPFAQSSLLHSHTHPSPLTSHTHPSPLTSHTHPSPLTSPPTPYPSPVHPPLTWSTHPSPVTPHQSPYHHHSPGPPCPSVHQTCLQSPWQHRSGTRVWRAGPGTPTQRHSGGGGEGRGDWCPPSTSVAFTQWRSAPPGPLCPSPHHTCLQSPWSDLAGTRVAPT